MRRIFWLLCFIVFTSTAYAQKFAPGYYVKNSGDTVKTNVFLKKKAGYILGLLAEDGQSFGPKDIRAMGVGYVNYVVRILPVDKSPKAGTVIDTTFLEVVNRQKIALLSLLDEYDKSHFFIEDENGAITELGLKVLDQGDGMTFQELPAYKQTLRGLFPACTELFPAIEKTRYNSNAIRSIYEKLYECKYGEAPKMQTGKNVITDAGLMLGVSSTDLTFEEAAGFPAIASRLTFDKSTDITGGIFIESKFARTSDVFTLRHELTHRKYDVTSEDYYKGVGQTQVFGSVSANYLKYNVVLRSALTRNALKPFLNIGASGSFLIKSSNRLLTISNGIPRTETLLGKVKSFEFGVFGGAGAMYQNFSLEVRYEKSAGLDPEYCITAVQTIYVLFSYRFLEGGN